MRCFWLCGHNVWCIAGGRVVYHVLLYGRVWLLTLFFSAIGAPLSRRRATVLSMSLVPVPYSPALCRAVSPSYNRDTQTDRNRLGWHDQTVKRMCIYMCICVRQCSGLRCKSTTAACMYCMYVFVYMRCGGLWHVLLVCTGTLSYCMGRVAYVVLLCDAGSSIQEEGDYADLAIGGSPVQGGGSLLQQGHRQTGRCRLGRQAQAWMPRDHPHNMYYVCILK